jgi:hypothetical protein
VERQREQIHNVNAAWDERAYFEALRLTPPETLDLFRATFNTAAGKEVLPELMRRWHFFDPYLAEPEHVQKRRCIMEILILSGMWHPEGMDTMVLACTQQASKGWIRRLLDTLRCINLKAQKTEKNYGQ